MDMVSQVSFDELLRQAAGWLLWAAACWGLLIFLAATLEVLSRGRLRATTWVGAPAPLRRLLFAALGAAIASVPGQTWATSSPGASEPSSGSCSGAQTRGPAATDPLAIPVRPLGQSRTQLRINARPQSKNHSKNQSPIRPRTRQRSQLHSHPQTQTRQHAPAGVQPHTRTRSFVVKPGDTLWQLAESLLSSRAGAAEVLALTHRLHQRNRGVIGKDPDVIRPGQRLELPSLPTPAPRPRHDAPEQSQHTEETR